MRLVSVGLSGQGTLDKVAGPVGEALIMTTRSGLLWRSRRCWLTTL